jgi:ribosomal protein S18 acetylase RimI-like enzyme
MDIIIRKLTPDLAEDYVNFFDTTPHDYNVDEHKCYCVCWCSEDSEGKDFSTREKRRVYAVKYVKENILQGYLAYYNDKVVGWCNANTKSDCLNCAAWRRNMGLIPTDESTPDIKVKSIFCFTIAPEMKRKGIATQLLERVCQDAVQDGFDYIEAYPNKEFVNDIDFTGPIEMYRKSGFVVSYETKQNFVVRKHLK